MCRARAFTLIELLVVISIIALLIAILLPVLSSARTSAIVMQCGSNNRQLAISATGFATENRGRFAARDDNTSKVANAWKHGNDDLWAENWLTFMEGEFENVPALVLCPNSNNRGETWESTVMPNWSISDYAYYPTYYERIVEGAGGDANDWVAVDRRGETLRTATGLEDPSDSPLFGDALYESDGVWRVANHSGSNGQGSNSFVAQALGESATVAPDPAGGNQAHLDGSVQWFDISEYEVVAQDFFGSSPRTWWVAPE